MFMIPILVQVIQVCISRHHNGDILSSFVAGPGGSGDCLLFRIRLLGPRLVVRECRLVVLPDCSQSASHSRASRCYSRSNSLASAIKDMLWAGRATKRTRHAGSPACPSRIRGLRHPISNLIGSQLASERGRASRPNAIIHSPVWRLVTGVDIVVIQMLRDAVFVLFFVAALTPHPRRDTNGRDGYRHCQWNPMTPYTVSARRAAIIVG